MVGLLDMDLQWWRRRVDNKLLLLFKMNRGNLVREFPGLVENQIKSLWRDLGALLLGHSVISTTESLLCALCTRLELSIDGFH